MEQEPGAVEVQDENRCAECGTVLTEGQDRQQTEDAVFCRPCFNNLTAQVQEAIAAQTRDINYPMALVGGLIGGAIGVVAWWGFTVVTNIAFGLVAIVIGLAVAKGIVILSGDKRGLNLQIMSVVISTLGFFYASYLVNRTFINRAYAEQGQDMALSDSRLRSSAVSSRNQAPQLGDAVHELASPYAPSRCRCGTHGEDLTPSSLVVVGVA